MTERAEQSKEPDVSSKAFIYAQIKTPFDKGEFERAFGAHLNALAHKHGVQDYTILYLLDEDQLTSWHSNRIYRAASAANKIAPILLVLDNLGGSIEAGYLISKTCKRLSKDKFVVAVPRKAKSAATLLALGADEVHMGPISELGPIDPQIGGLPALGMKNALEILSDLACKYPGASKMLADYIGNKLDLRILGYFERINDSARQYAERLLAGKPLQQPNTPQTLADHFVNHYKDHGFVIDYDETRDLLGDKIAKRESAEYNFANSVYESFDFARYCLSVELNKSAELVGASTNGIRVADIKSTE